MQIIEVNGRRYRLPQQPIVIICYDRCDPAYIRRGIADGVMPNTAWLAEVGFMAYAKAVVPTSTNPNNLSIVTGLLPTVQEVIAGVCRECGQPLSPSRWQCGP